MAANLTSPTNEFSASPITTSTPKEIDEKPKTEEPKGSIVGLRSTKFNLEKKASPSPEAKPRSTSTLPTSAAAEDNTPSPAVPSTHFNPKPKPLPKPRPWSIVGVDRKSGEVTSVDTNEKQPTTVSNDKPKSVRDMINNMNKDGGGTSSSTVNAGETSKKKGSSLPRGTQAPTGSEISANSPKTGKKTDSTSDDPRILKLDDDYAYEGVMDV